MAQSNLSAMNKFPSVHSIHSMVSMGYLPPGHGYIPKKIKPDKPYGPSYLTILNRTWRGPGRYLLKYALITFCLAMLFYISAALYFGHRNVSRMIVLHTEPLGACLLIVAILMTSLTFYLLYHARMASNRWRSYLKFRPDGLFHVQPVNDEYSPKDPTKLKTGTYGPRAVKEIPKPKFMRKSRPGSRAGGRKQGAPLMTLDEGNESIESDINRIVEGVDGPHRFNDEAPNVTKPSLWRPGEPDDEPPMTQLSRAPQVEKIVPMERMPTQMRGPSDHYPGRFPSEGRMTPGLERMPPSAMRGPTPGMDVSMRQAPGYRMPVGFHQPPPGAPGLMSEARMTPGAQNPYSPEPRMPPGQGRQTPGLGQMQTSEPRMVPGQGRQTPGLGQMQASEPRMVPGQGRQTPGLGQMQVSQPRMVPGQGRQTPGLAQMQAPEPRMVPGQSRQVPEPRMAPGQSQQRLAPGQGRQTPQPRMAPGNQNMPPQGPMEL